MLTAFILIFTFSTSINAHNTYHPDNDDGYFGNRSMGWRGDFKNHVYVAPNNPQVLYEFDYDNSDMSAFNSWGLFDGDINAFETLVEDGIDLWNNTGIVSINEYNGYNPTGVVVGKIVVKDFRNTNYDNDALAVTSTPLRTLTVMGHVDYWTIYINTNINNLLPEYIAHEFGHVMGLCDTGFFGLMYGQDELTYERPTEKEIFGVSVMLGLNHSWDYQLYNTINGNSQHALKCQDCNGYKIDNVGNIILSLCVYGSNGRCTYCGALPGTSINNIDDDYLIE